MRQARGLRRWVASALSLTTAAVGAVVALAPAAPASAASASSPIIFGAAATQGPKVNGFLAYDKTWGRTVGDARLYFLWDSYKPDPTGKKSIFPGPSGAWARDNHVPILMSVKAKMRDGSKLSWANIANAKPGSSYYTDIVGWATAIKSYGVKVYFNFNHEPEAAASKTMGTAADYIKAWQNIHDIFTAQGLTSANVEYVWIATSYGFTRNTNVAQNYYPGDAYVDDIGADVYNWADCRPEVKTKWQSLQQMINPTTVPKAWPGKSGRSASEYGLVRFGAQHPTKGLMLTEFGTVEWQDAVTASSPSKASWLEDAEALFQQPAYSQFTLINLWNSVGNGTHSTCDFRIGSSPSALAAMQAWGQDPAYLPTS